MNIVLFRIDERFIHGQILQGWRGLEYQHIVVISDKIAEDKMGKELQLIGVPDGVTACFYNKKELPDMIRDQAKNTRRTIILVGNVEDALLVVQSGIKADRLNLGVMSRNSFRTHTVSNAVYVSPEEMDVLKQIADMGIVVEVQGVERDAAVRLF
ncbi:PTS sugar transporter subunit IIB [bacterium]|nr:PTS sugar transporter subunit IIB [bacterium]MBU1753990.1 PTS sugar transporter subunit IIB [bacterium]